MCMDRSGGIGDGNNYLYWNFNFIICELGYFIRFIDGSFIFEDCIIIDGDFFWGILVVDRNGDLYIIGIDGGNIIVVKFINVKDFN